jgi:CDP-diglyceride synthetase
MQNRVITAFLLLGIAIFVIYYGQLPMYLWVSFVGLACAYELIQMAKKNTTTPYAIPIYAAVVCAITSAYLPMTQGLWRSPAMMIAAMSVLAFSFFELWHKKLFFTQTRWAMTHRRICLAHQPLYLSRSPGKRWCFAYFFFLADYLGYRCFGLVRRTIFWQNTPE